MIRLKSILLEQTKSKNNIPNALFIGDDTVISGRSYANKLIKSGAVTGKVAGAKKLDGLSLVRYVKKHINKSYNVVSITIGNIDDKNKNISNTIDHISTAISEAGSFGAKVIIIQSENTEPAIRKYLNNQSEADAIIEIDKDIKDSNSINNKIKSEWIDNVNDLLNTKIEDTEPDDTEEPETDKSKEDTPSDKKDTKKDSSNNKLKKLEPETPKSDSNKNNEKPNSEKPGKETSEPEDEKGLFGKAWDAVKNTLGMEVNPVNLAAATVGASVLSTSAVGSNTYGIPGASTGGEGGDWGGSMGRVLAFAKVAMDTMGKNYAGSQKRARKLTASGNTSDHYENNLSAYAVDMGVRSRKEGDQLLANLMAWFGRPDYKGGYWLNVNKDGYRYQVGWRVPDHYDHVHVGVKKIGATKDIPVNQLLNKPEKKDTIIIPDSEKKDTIITPDLAVKPIDLNKPAGE